MKGTAGLYEFAFRGLLTEEALDAAGRVPGHLSGMTNLELSETVSLDSLDPALVEAARRMSVVYTAIAAFENSARKLVKTVLIEEVGEAWWEESVSQKIRARAEARRKEEEDIKWHGQRGTDLLNYTELGDLSTIMASRAEAFEPYVRSVDWARAVFKVIERSRNVIMHGGTLDDEDVARVGIYIRDWVKQVGA
ncbi:MAG: Swt1 family HEPN domain-containing protein [Actinomycetota bacterium]